MSACTEVSPLLEARLTDSLGADAARLGGHLATCAACRAEAASQDELLSLAQLPAPSADDLRALEGLPLLTWRALERGRVRRLSMWGGLGLAAAAALAFVVAAPHRTLTSNLPMTASATSVGSATPAVASAIEAEAEADLAAASATGDDASDDTLDLEDFASLDGVLSTGMTAVAGSDDEDDDDTNLFQGEEL